MSHHSKRYDRLAGRLEQPIEVTEQSWPDGSSPVVSVLCTTFNHGQFIKMCIEGLLAQKTNFPVEILVHDDASTDDTADILKEYAKKYPNIIKPILQVKNQYSKGVKPNLKFNLPRALGEYIAFCEGDDYWTCPDKLQTQIDYLENHPESVACFANSIVIDQQGSIVREERVPEKYQRRLNQLDIVSGFCPPTNTMLFRRSSLGTLPRVSKKVVNVDFIISAQLAEHGTIEYLPGSMAAYRIHDGGIWSSRSEDYLLLNSLRTRSALLIIYKEKYRDILRPVIETYYMRLKSSYIDKGEVVDFISISLSKLMFNHRHKLGNGRKELRAFFINLRVVVRNWALKI